MRLAQRGLLVIFVPFFVQLLLTGWLWSELFHAQKDLSRNVRSETLVKYCNQLMREMSEYVFSVSLMTNRQTGYQEHTSLNTVNFDKNLSALSEILRAQHREPDLERLTLISTQVLRTLDDAAAEINQGGTFRQAGAETLEGDGLMQAREFNLVLHDIMQSEQESKFAGMQRIQQRRQTFNLALGIAAVVGVSISALVSVLFVIDLRSRIGFIGRDVKRFALREPLARLLEGNDELAILDRVIHDMDKIITEATARERVLVDNAADLICSIDRQGSFQRVNWFSRRLLGIEPDALVGTSVLGLVAGEDSARAHTELENASASGRQCTFETRLQRATAQTVDTSWSTFWSTADQSLFCVISEITERKNIERLKEDFMAMISHDLRTPLMSLSIDISLLSRATQTLPPSAIEALTTVDGKVQRLMALVNDLLDYQKLQAGKMQLLTDAVAVDTLLADCWCAIQGSDESPNPKMRIAHSPGGTVGGDRQKLQQALKNLIQYLLDASPSSGAIELAARLTQTAVEICLADELAGEALEGGIERAKAEWRRLPPAIFEPFARAQSQSDPEQLPGRTGLDLALAKLLIEAQGGQVDARETSRGGLSFWLMLPLDTNRSES